ncbi:MAB_1171c family putative transporter [Nocardia nepalensis]|uniref:MAB_1171c family putative transporter n=1 Tax=Nocardia nepalensis TaxID=3375448 RepID=UPI003B66B4A3
MLHSSWPAAIALPLIGYAWALVAIRAFTFRATSIERRATFVFAALTTAATIRERTVQDAVGRLSAGHLSNALLFQLGLILIAATAGVMILTLAKALGHNYSPAVVHSTAILCATISLICGTSARDQGIMIETQTGWAPLGFWLPLLVPTVWIDYSVTRLSIAEMRRRSDRREFLLYGALALFPGLHLIVFGCAPISATFQIVGTHTVFARILTATDRDIMLFQTLVFAAALSVPMLLRLAQRLGMDTFARSRKQLLPLWADLTGACPEIVYRDVAPTGLGSRFLLHRTVIEIRDCLRILSRYAPPESGRAASSDTPDTDRLRYAVRLAQACAAKADGAAPHNDVLAKPSEAADVDAEIIELTALAACWSRARAIAAESRRSALFGAPS